MTECDLMWPVVTTLELCDRMWHPLIRFDHIGLFYRLWPFRPLWLPVTSCDQFCLYKTSVTTCELLWPMASDQWSDQWPVTIGLTNGQWPYQNCVTACDLLWPCGTTLPLCNCLLHMVTIYDHIRPLWPPVTKFDHIRPMWLPSSSCDQLWPS